MGTIKKVKIADLNINQKKQVDLSSKIINLCSEVIEEGDQHLAVGGVATAFSSLIASILYSKDKDEAMDCVNDLLNDVKKAAFAQMEIINMIIKNKELEG